jgi:hypothetical protein
MALAVWLTTSYIVWLTNYLVRNYPGVPTAIFPSPVQGEGCAIYHAADVLMGVDFNCGR